VPPKKDPRHITANDNDSDGKSGSKNEGYATMLVEGAGSYWLSLKLRFAQVLTDSLSQKERENLINSIEPGNRVNKSSVGEAVARALAKEQQFQSEYIERIEQAALDRLETERQLRASIEKELSELKASSEESSGDTEILVEEEGNVFEIESDQQYQPYHPVLGKLIANLGYKRVYLTETQHLSNIPIWQKQRAYRHSRAKIIAQEKLKRKEVGLPGVITLFENRVGEMFVIDGQHRVGMLTLLNTDNRYKSRAKDLALNLEEILVEVFPIPDDCEEETFAADVFTDINKSEPVKIIDLPQANDSTRDYLRIINPAAEIIETMFPEMFKPSMRCLPPHLNIDNFRVLLFDSNVVDRCEIKNSDDMVKWILDSNEKMAKRYEDAREIWEQGLELYEESIPLKMSLVLPKKYSERILDKARANNFYLGLDNTWLS